MVFGRQYLLDTSELLQEFTRFSTSYDCYHPEALNEVNEVTFELHLATVRLLEFYVDFESSC